MICPKNKSASHCPTELFPIYPNNQWTIRQRDNHIVVPSSNRIKLKIDWILFAAYLSKIWQRFLKTNVDKMYYKNFTHFLMSKYVFSRGFLFKILALCMVNIQEWFQIKSRIWWYAYIIYLVSLNFKLITKHFRICAKKFSALLKAQVVPETSFYSVLIVEIPKWSWILPQIDKN